MIKHDSQNHRRSKRGATVLFSLMMLPIAANAALHFGTGAAYFDDKYIFYTDKGYYENFSTDIGLYSDLDQSHMAYLNIHLYTELSRSSSGITPILYGGIGGIFSKDTDNYTHEHSSNEHEENWGIRFPLGIELMTNAALSVYAEVVPTYIYSPNDEYDTSTTIGIRYYFY